MRNQVGIACQRQRQDRIAQVCNRHVTRDDFPIEETYAVVLFGFQRDGDVSEIPCCGGTMSGV